MGFDISAAINGAADKLTANAKVRSIASSPISTALLMATCIFFILLFVFRDVEGVATFSMRGSFYIFLMLLGTLFIHNRVLLSESESAEVGANVAAVFEESGRGTGVLRETVSGAAEWSDGEIVPVYLETTAM